MPARTHRPRPHRRTLAAAVLAAILLAAWVLPGAAASLDQAAADLARHLRPGERAAVSALYDNDTGDVTALGQLWRDRLEVALRKRAVPLITRRDLGALAEDLETFTGGDQGLFQRVGADVLIVGRYYLHPGDGLFELHLKALRRDGAVAGAGTWIGPLEPGWPARAARVKANVYQRRVERVTGAPTGPTLSARLDRDPPCYPSGAQAVVKVRAQPDSHLYLLLIAADRTVTLLHPNRLTPDRPLPADTFEFPPLPLRRSGRLTLELYPLGKGPTREVIKVVATRTPLDLAFLPVPENQILVGAKGGDLERLAQALEAATDRSEVSLPYWVGPGCE